MQWPNEKGQKDQIIGQNTTQKIKNWATRSTLNTGMNSGVAEGWAVPALLVAHSQVNNRVIVHECRE
jgi:hypothetical protein